MKLLVALFCSFSVILISQAAQYKRYFGDNIQNHFIPNFESQLYQSLRGRGHTFNGVGSLTTSLLHDIHVRAGSNFNIVLSPISIWTILAVLLEGAGGKTENELKSKLQVSYNTHEEGKQILHNRYKELTNFKGKNGVTDFTVLNFLITDTMKMVDPSYKNTIGQFYNVKHFEVNNIDVKGFSRMINTWASQASKNKIQTIVSPEILDNLLLVIGNAVYFKSKWKYPFDPTQTFFMPFKDEFERPIKDVQMMHQVVTLPYTYNTQLQCEIVEIPYADDTTSMVVLLPRERISLRTVLSKMRRMNLEQFLPKNFTEETLQLSLPKFHITGKMYLNEVLKQDLRSMFTKHAEFPYIGKNIYVSKISHEAVIENTEEGTEASAISSVQFAYKSSSVPFTADRPFIYLIIERKTKTVLFAGTYSNPFMG